MASTYPLPTKAERQIAKLELAQTKRQQTGTVGYRELRYYDANLLPARYQENDTVRTPHPDGLVQGRPWKSTPNILAGLWRTTYTGYHGNDPTWFDAQPPEAITESVEVQNFSILASLVVISAQWLGYFRAPHTANYTFYILSDDEANFWIGDKAITGYTIENRDVYAYSSDPVQEYSNAEPIALVAGQYYPIRLQWGNQFGNGGLNGFSWEDDFGFPTYERVDPTGGTINTEQTDAFKLTVQSTSYEVEPHVKAQIGINDVLTVNTSSRGHTILAMTPTGTVIEQQTFDTWLVENIQPMQFALNSYPIGTVIAICTYDACQFHTNLRATLQDSYGATLTDVWGDGFPRHSHIFIGTRV